MIMSAPLVPVGFFWYGWSAQAQVHWIVPILGNVVLGVGILASMVGASSFTLLLLLLLLLLYADFALHVDANKHIHD